MKCEECKYWEFLSDDSDGIQGMCRRYSPCLFGPSEDDKSWPPLTYNDEWCGEFEAKLDATQLAIEEMPNLVRKFLERRAHFLKKPVTTVGEFLALTEYDIFDVPRTGHVTLSRIRDEQHRLRGGGKTGNELYEEEQAKKAETAVREALSI